MPPMLDSLVRSRLPQACAECRRLKLKCDKKKPCSSCVRRGCASVCPQGRMVSKGSRFILANTEQLHKKIDALIDRVRQLETALEESHLLHSSEPHPLLLEELRLIATPVEAAASEPDPATKNSEELAESMGMLTLDHHGTRYFGSTGAFSFLWRDPDYPDETLYKFKGVSAQALAGLPTEVAQLAHAFPICLPTTDTLDLTKWILENCLPPFPEAWSLFENYWEHYAWHFSPLTRASFVEQIFSPIYHRSQDHEDKPLGHRLGLLFIVFAIGEFMDLTRPLTPLSGMRYYLLARASLCLNPVLESPTVTALQAMYLVGVYIMLSRGTSEPEHSWVLSGINIKLALTLGLHHDADKFQLPADEVENRRFVLTSVLVSEIWQCLNSGRPLSLTLGSFDWIFSKDRPEATSPDSPMYWRSWAMSFIRDCLCKVLETTVMSKATSYNAILQLDARIREYPTATLSDMSRRPDGLSLAGTIQQTFMGIMREAALLLLHRRCFAIALQDTPDDLLKSPFAPSVVACHCIATAFISRIRSIHSAYPGIILRIWFIWPHVFVATLVLGSIVARSPGCSLASAALLDLESACRLWEVASDAVCGARVRETVSRLKQKAFTAFAQNKAPRSPFRAAPGGMEVLDEIHALGGGGPRVISTMPQTSSASPPYASEQKRAGSHHSSPQSVPSPEHPSPHTSSVDPRLWTPLSEVPADSSTSANSAFDVNGFYSSHHPTLPDGALPNDFGDIYGTVDPSVSLENLPVGATILEELGLGGAWQPVMDHLGL